MKRLFWESVLVLVLLGLAVVPVLAAEAQEGGVPSFDAWLMALAGPLVGGAVAIILSWVVEYWPAYENLAPRFKRLAFFGLCLVVPVSAALLRAALGYVALTFDPLVWHALWNGAAAAGIGTLAHARKLPA